MTTVTVDRPQTYGPRDVIERTTATLRDQAAAKHADYRQYAGYWDGWRIVEITRPISTKRGVVFEDGDMVLCSPRTFTEKIPPAEPAPYEQWPVETFTTCYSWRTHTNTAVPPDAIRDALIVDAGELLSVVSRKGAALLDTTLCAGHWCDDIVRTGAESFASVHQDGRAEPIAWVNTTGTDGATCYECVDEARPHYSGDYTGVDADYARTSAQLVAPGAYIGEGDLSEQPTIIFGNPYDMGVAIAGAPAELRALVARLAELVEALPAE